MWGAQYSRHNEYTYYFPISNYSNASEDISDCRNSFNCKPKKLINELINSL